MTNPLSTDIAVIGAGTAGLTAFNAIKRAGASALLIDRGPLGTTCARVGCMPSKAALHAGQRWATARELRAEPKPQELVKPNDLWRHVRTTRDQLAHDAAELTVEVAGDRLLMGEARFVAENTLEVAGQRISARAFILATGSRPVVPASLAALGDRLLTTDTLFELETLPASIGILGVGAVGLEMGLALARLGVRVVGGDLKTTLAGIEDPEVRSRAIERFSRELTLWLGHEVEALAAGDRIELRSGGSKDSVDKVLAALGRAPNVEALDLAHTGVETDAQGRFAIDPHTLRVGEAVIFMAGDVSPDRPLMHEAVDEGLIAALGALQIVNGRQVTLPSRRTPISIVFSDPDIAAVGDGFDSLDHDRTVIGTAAGSTNGRSRILGAEGNLVRIYVDRNSGVLRGASLIATHGEHLAHSLAWAVQRGETVDELLRMPFYHPSVEEMIQTALKDVAHQLWSVT